MLALVITVHIIVAILIVSLVLLQQGKGANMGASFGSGASQTVFGSRGAAPFMFKLTAVLVAVFFVTSLSLSYIGKQNATKGATGEAASGVSQADYQKQQEAQQALINQAKAPNKQDDKTASALQVDHLLKTPATTAASEDAQIEAVATVENKESEASQTSKK